MQLRHAWVFSVGRQISVDKAAIIDRYVFDRIIFMPRLRSDVWALFRNYAMELVSLTAKQMMGCGPRARHKSHSCWNIRPRRRDGRIDESGRCNAPTNGCHCAASTKEFPTGFLLETDPPQPH